MLLVLLRYIFEKRDVSHLEKKNNNIKIEGYISSDVQVEATLKHNTNDNLN